MQGFENICGGDCENERERDRGAQCIDCSHLIAQRDLDVLAKYKTNITTAAEEKCFPAPLLAAFISRQTMAGAEIEANGREWDGIDKNLQDSPGGWLYCHNSHKYCYGLMHMPDSELILCLKSMIHHKL